MNSKDHHKTLKTFYKYQTCTIRLIGLWKLSESVNPRCRTLHSIYLSYLLFLWKLTFDASCFIQFVTNITDLNEVIKIFVIFASSVAALSKFYTIKFKSHLYYELIDILHRSMFRPTNNREIKLFKQSQNLSRLMRNGYYCIALSTLHFFMLIQYFVDNTELPIPVYNPINMDTKWRYFMMYFYQYIAVSIGCYTNVAFDSLSCSFLVHLKGQLDILCDRLEHLGTEENKFVDNNKITLQLKNCIKYYDEIVRNKIIVEELVSFPVSMQIACSVMVLVANFYGMSILSDPGDYASFMKFLIYQFCMLSQIYILCYFCNEVTSKSREISYYLYCSKWMGWNKVNRKLLLLMTYRFDVPICIRSINPTYTFNLAAFTSIVNSSYSYYALLKNVKS